MTNVSLNSITGEVDEYDKKINRRELYKSSGELIEPVDDSYNLSDGAYQIITWVDCEYSISVNYLNEFNGEMCRDVWFILRKGKVRKVTRNKAYCARF